MSEQPRSPLTWFIAALLVAQLGLLWLHGALLHRQQAQLVQLHEDIQDLADALDAQTEGDSGDNGDNSDWAPAHARGHHARLRRAHLRLRQEEPKAPENRDSDAAEEAQRKELEASRQSGKEAVAKGRDLNQKLSIQENYRKGQEQRAVQEAKYEWTRWVWLAVFIVVLAFGVRAYARRNA